ncbi:MAG TPA: glycosyl hydrolase family 28 protein [Verrucomicrobiae bacterium]
MTGVTAGGEAPSNRLVAYPAPDGALLNHDFSVKVRSPGGAWQALPTYLVKVDAVRDTDHDPQDSSASYFDFSGTVEVSIVFNHGRIDSARIRPLSYGITPEVSGDELTFTLSQPRNLSVEVNGDIFHNLHLFANPMETWRPDLRDTNVIYYAAGLHEISSNRWHIASGKTVYLAGGAVLRGRILINGAENVRVLGRGMVEQGGRGAGAVRIANATNIEISGIIGSQFFTGGSRNVTIQNVKCLSYAGYGDGMNVISSSNVLIDGVFNRNSDDCFTVYGSRGQFHGDARDIRLQNSTLWADVAHPILIGTHGDPTNADTLADITVSNIDILDHNERQLDYQGCVSINAGDNNLVRHVRFENIRVEDFREGQLLSLRVFFNRKYCHAPGRGIEDVLFRNINYHGAHANPSIIAGYDDTRTVKDVVFENLVINGTVMSEEMEKPAWYKVSDMARIFVGEHVENLQFRPGSVSP